jgi:glucokinase
MILAGDIGGTKTNLALFERRDGRLHRVAQQRFASGDFGHAEDMLAEFLRGAGA